MMESVIVCVLVGGWSGLCVLVGFFVGAKAMLNKLTKMQRDANQTR